MNEFDDLVAVVTGGASGIGAATAAMLVARGARVAVLDRTAASTGKAEPMSVACDVTDDAGVRAAIDAVAGRLGGIDIVINNAGNVGLAGPASRCRFGRSTSTTSIPSAWRWRVSPAP